MQKTKLGAVGATMLSALLATAPATAGDEGDAKLVEIEKSLWAGWAKADTRPFEQHLAKDGVNMVPMGFTLGKEAMLKAIAGSDCKVASYTIGEVKVVRPAEKVALLAYSATQDAVCGDYRPPSSIHVTSVYVKKDGDWKAASYAETPAAR